MGGEGRRASLPGYVRLVEALTDAGVGRIGVVGPSDVLVVELPEHTTNETLNRGQEALRKVLGEGRFIIVAGAKTTIAKGNA